MRVVPGQPWSSIAVGTLVVGPSGRIWQLDASGTEHGAPWVALLDPETGERRSVWIGPADCVSVIESTDGERGAITVLSRSFPQLERIG